MANGLASPVGSVVTLVNDSLLLLVRSCLLDFGQRETRMRQDLSRLQAQFSPSFWSKSAEYKNLTLEIQNFKIQFADELAILLGGNGLGRLSNEASRRQVKLGA